jgi:hypothetical protein
MNLNQVVADAGLILIGLLGNALTPISDPPDEVKNRRRQRVSTIQAAPEAQRAGEFRDKLPNQSSR